MTDNADHNEHKTDLRRQAERELAARGDRVPTETEEIERALHELRVHQIELEMQNEELRRAHIDLETSQRRYWELFDLAPVAYFTLRPNNLIVDANQAAARLLGHERAFLRSRPFSNFVGPNEIESFYGFRNRLLKTHRPCSCELTMRQAENGRFLIARLDGLALRDDQDNITELRLAATDVTEQRQAERALQAAHDDLERRVHQRTAELARTVEELRRSNADLQQFAYVASHDLQEPLRMVTSFVQLLKIRCGDKLPGECYHYIDVAVEGALRMQALVKDLLDYSRLTTRAQEPQPIEAADVVAAVLENLRMTIDETHARVDVGELPAVLADPTHLLQVFQNLIENALKFRSEAPPHIRIAARRADGWWQFDVADNGIGMDPQYFDKIFVIFQRLHNRQKYPGTGIGLALCKKIIERHGGKIWVDSQPGQGTTVHFTLPAA
ncbi:MAG: PAS domain S-box protein [Phycisphaerae bacterium]|nr:PAS domain S-box protein [Phycisphaerae bacterium]